MCVVQLAKWDHAVNDAAKHQTDVAVVVFQVVLDVTAHLGVSLKVLTAGVVVAMHGAMHACVLLETAVQVGDMFNHS